MRAFDVLCSSCWRIGSSSCTCSCRSYLILVALFSLIQWNAELPLIIVSPYEKFTHHCAYFTLVFILFVVLLNFCDHFYKSKRVIFSTRNLLNIHNSHLSRFSERLKNSWLSNYIVALISKATICPVSPTINQLSLVRPRKRVAVTAW